jgi:hypothetical protein
MIASAAVRNEGQFSMDGKKWAPFSSNQIVITQRLGFDWDARVSSGGRAPSTGCGHRGHAQAWQGSRRNQADALIILASDHLETFPSSRNVSLKSVPTFTVVAGEPEHLGVRRRGVGRGPGGRPIAALVLRKPLTACRTSLRQSRRWS